MDGPSTPGREGDRVPTASPRRRPGARPRPKRSRSITLVQTPAKSLTNVVRPTSLPYTSASARGSAWEPKPRSVRLPGSARRAGRGVAASEDGLVVSCLWPVDVLVEEVDEAAAGQAAGSAGEDTEGGVLAGDAEHARVTDKDGRPPQASGPGGRPGRRGGTRQEGCRACRCRRGAPAEQVDGMRRLPSCALRSLPVTDRHATRSSTAPIRWHPFGKASPHHSTPAPPGERHRPGSAEGARVTDHGPCRRGRGPQARPRITPPGRPAGRAARSGARRTRCRASARTRPRSRGGRTPRA